MKNPIDAIYLLDSKIDELLNMFSHSWYSHYILSSDRTDAIGVIEDCLKHVRHMDGHLEAVLKHLKRDSDNK